MHALFRGSHYAWKFVACSILAASLCVAAQAVEFKIHLDPQVAAAPISGRLYVFLSQRNGGEPRFGPNWFAPEPFARADVRDFRPGETRIVDDAAEAFPESLSKLPAGTYRVQALLDHDFYHQNAANGAGNLYSRVAEVEHMDGDSKVVEMTLDRQIAEEPFPETDFIREVVITSKLLSKFHGREVLDRAAVILPKSYHDQPQRRYPTVYIIPGFGGSHRTGGRFLSATQQDGEVEFIGVMLSGDCKWGHHVYADSATNGPRGESLIEEMIPHIDRQYRTVAAPTARFVTGHSSGGWSSLWLQVEYPDQFGGVWSIAPDPVDFRDFQQVDLYADPPLSLYYDEQANRRPLARRGDQPVLWFPAFAKMDDVLGRGGQLRSFEAVFSPLDSQGLPQRLWDRQSGRIDPAVAKSWEKYDIRLKLERNWRQLGPKLAGKLHITTGSLDTFYLNGAVEKLAESLKKLGSDAQIEIVPGADHGSVATPELMRSIRRQMSAAYLQHHSPEGDEPRKR